MTDELLERATRAYRAETSPDSRNAEALLERIETNRRATYQVNRRTLRVTAFALSAALVGAGAWAGATGRISGLVARVVAFSSPSPVGTSAAGTSAREQGRSRVPAPPVTPPAHAVETTAPTASTEPPPHVQTPVAVTAVPDAGVHQGHGRLARIQRGDAEQGAAPSTLAPATLEQAPATDVDALYRDAHEAHFKKHDYAAALTAWDVYLAAAKPDSRMLIEARYNRGIALARLGRRDDAIRALQPFAEGEYGEYRREEARRVIEKLRH